MDITIILGQQPKNLAFRNFDETKLPTGTKELLGLGLKFCIEKPKPDLELRNTFQQLTRSIRIRYHVRHLEKQSELE